jgi:hypothetical protein
MGVNRNNKIIITGGCDNRVQLFTRKLRVIATLGQ